MSRRDTSCHHLIIGVAKVLGHVLAAIFLCSACILGRQPVRSEAEIFCPPAGGRDLLPALAPTFLVADAGQTYNAIGTPMVHKRAGGQPEVVVDASHATLYGRQQEFATARGSYRNLVYRVHFEKVPFWSAEGGINLTTGKNVGLLVVLTVNSANQVVLVTTVHTCGCYLAFLPTDALPQEALPLGWPQTEQCVYGYTLPTVIKAPQADGSARLIIAVASDTHRVSAVWTTTTANPDSRYRVRAMPIMPMAALDQLPNNRDTLSFFEKTGLRQGYVKGSSKPLERLLMSWWALDWRIGEDKALGHDGQTGAAFYTSLQFWNRQASDMTNFPAFLAFWGWRL